MSANPQWDISRALGVARLFHLVCGVRDACVAPFLTLYLRQLGLAAPWVGVLMGTKHLIAASWGPFGAFLAKSYRKRRALLMGSLLGSAGASLLMVLVPPLDHDRQSGACNASGGATATALPPGGALPGTFAWTQPQGAPSPPAERPPGTAEASGFGKGPAESVREPSGRPPGYAVRSVEGAGTTSRAAGVEETPREGALEVGRTALPLLAGGPAPGGPANWSAAEGSARALGAPSSEGLRWTFLLSLGAVAFWELLAAPLEQVADDSLYEYLDFVDATDRYRSLWNWRLLGLSAGACGIAALVGQPECSLATNGPRGVWHFYGYSLVSTLACLVSLAFPVPTCRRREPSYRTIKALSLVGGDPRLLLLALTVFLTGAATSAVQNFLFWHMKDRGSSELVMGVSVALGWLGEMVLHPFQTTMLRKLTRVGTVALGLGCLAGQLLYYSFLWSWWSVLPAQAWSALSSGALWWAVKASVEHLATPGSERPLGAMFRGHFSGGGSSLGSFAGGFVVMSFGVAALFRACCVGLLLWLALFLSVRRTLPQEQKINYSKLLVVEASDTSDSEQGTERDWLVKALREERSD